MTFSVPEQIQTLFPYIPGKPIEETERELGIEVVAKLASNENPLGPGSKALEAATRALQSAHLYPDGASFYLKQALAEHLGVRPDELLVGNGSNELLVLLVRTFCRPEQVPQGPAGPDTAVISDGSFIVYRLACHAHGVRQVRVPLKDRRFDLDAMADAIDESTRIVFIANPNNPTGTYVSKAELEGFLDKVPERCLVVLDEAYLEYVDAEDYPDGLTLRDRHPGLVVSRTFSKIHGLASLRCGYMVADPCLVEQVNKVRDPFNVNAIAQAAAQAALGDTDHVSESRRVNLEGLRLLEARLPELGVQVAPSVANFVLADFDRPGAEVYEGLLREGVIIRPMAGYGFEKSARITVGLPEENERLLGALARVIG